MKIDDFRNKYLKGWFHRHHTKKVLQFLKSVKSQVGQQIYLHKQCLTPPQKHMDKYPKNSSQWAQARLIGSVFRRL